MDNIEKDIAQGYADFADDEGSIEEVEAEDIYTGYKYIETRNADTVLGQGNADATVGSSTGKAWNYDD